LILAIIHKLRGRTFLGISSVVKKPIQGLYVMPIRDTDGYHFFEYRFPLSELIAYVKRAGFDILEAFPAYNKTAIHHDLSPLAGKWDYVNGDPNLNFLGQIVYKYFRKHFSHMAVCVARKNGQQ